MEIRGPPAFFLFYLPCYFILCTGQQQKSQIQIGLTNIMQIASYMTVYFSLSLIPLCIDDFLAKEEDLRETWHKKTNLIVHFECLLNGKYKYPLDISQICQL